MHFSPIGEVIADEYLADLPENYYNHETHKLEKRWNNCIGLLREYNE